MKKTIIFKKTSIIIAVLFSSILFSCSNVNKIENTNIAVNEATKSEIKKDDSVGDKLVSLERDVYTLSHYELPEVGDELYGFKVNAIYDYSARNAKVVEFSHEKSGATLFLISNNDEDKTAAFGFNTLAFDDKGIPHVFEHACLGGSEKYPNSNLFDEAVNRTYNTFMNAFTMQHATVYPFSSLSDPQLFEIYKFYMDGVLNPNIIRDEKNLEKEAYRYTLYNEKDDLKLNGVVYSEMAGNEAKINDVAYRNSLKTMFNKSYMGVNTGGATSEIPNITHEDLIEFHKKYYSPCNMVIMLYGDIDYKKYLKYADEEYLCKYDKQEIDKSDDNYVKQNEFHIETFDFPVASDSDIDGQTMINYNVICDEMTPYESGLFELVLGALDGSDGPLNKRLKEKLGEADYEIDNALFFPKPYFSINFFNVNSEDADTVKEIVEESFAELVSDGIKQDVLEDAMNYIELELENNKDSHGFANVSSYFYARTFSTNGENLLGFLQCEKAMNELKQNYENGKVKELIDRYLTDNKNSSMNITVPKRGLLEENSLKLKNDLKRLKNGLINDEIKELITKTKEYDKWIEEETKNSMIEVLRVATISELDEYKAKCYAYEEKIEGIDFIRSEIEDIKYNHFNIMFDISNLNTRDAMKLKFIASLLPELPSKNYEGQKLKAALNKYASLNSVGINVNEYYNGGYKPYFEFATSSLDRNLDKVFELLKELMNEMIFEDVSLVRRFASSELKSYKNYAVNSPTSLANDIINVKTNKDAIYSYSISGIKYMEFLKEISSMSDDELREFLKEGESIYKGTYNRQGMICQIIGNFDTAKNIKNRIVEMAYDFKNEKVKNKIDVATISELKKNVATVVNGTVQYNYVAIPLRDDGIDYTAKQAVLSRIIDDKILYQEFRVKRSAYGAYTHVDRLKSYVFTYRDPNLRETYDTIQKLPSYISKIALTEEELDDYKLNAYSSFAYPLTKIDSAIIAVNEILNKTTENRSNRYIRYMKEIKDMKVEDIKELAKDYTKLVKDGFCVTVGGREAIEMNADYFDEVIYDYVK